MGRETDRRQPAAKFQRHPKIGAERRHPKIAPRPRPRPSIPRHPKIGAGRRTPRDGVRTPLAKVRRRGLPVPSWKWLVLAACISVIALRWGDGQAIAIAATPVPDRQQIAREGEPVLAEWWDGTTPVPSAGPGPLTDIVACLEEGIHSDAACVESLEEEEILRRWAAVLAENGADGITLILVPGASTDVRTYDVSFDGFRIVGRLRVERVDGAWQVVGVSAARATNRG